MIKKKKQKIQEGSIVKINLSGNDLSFARLLPGLSPKISVFDFFVDKECDSISMESIVNSPILFYVTLFNEIITKGLFEIVGYKSLSDKDIENIPPSFVQDLVNIDDCVIFWNSGKEQNVTPNDCIGLERVSVWTAVGIVQRIEDWRAGRKNFQVEMDKVILSKDDPRYLPAPQTLRWDFEKQKFYRTDR